MLQVPNIFIHMYPFKLDENFTDDKLTIKTIKITCLKKLVWIWYINMLLMAWAKYLLQCVGQHYWSRVSEWKVWEQCLLVAAERIKMNYSIMKFPPKQLFVHISSMKNLLCLLLCTTVSGYDMSYCPSVTSTEHRHVLGLRLITNEIWLNVQEH